MNSIALCRIGVSPGRGDRHKAIGDNQRLGHMVAIREKMSERHQKTTSKKKEGQRGGKNQRGPWCTKPQLGPRERGAKTGGVMGSLACSIAKRRLTKSGRKRKVHGGFRETTIREWMKRKCALTRRTGVQIRRLEKFGQRQTPARRPLKIPGRVLICIFRANGTAYVRIKEEGEENYSCQHKTSPSKSPKVTMHTRQSTQINMT